MNTNVYEATTINEFAEALADELKERLCKDYDLQVSTEARSILKTNGERIGITIRPEGVNIAPTIYVDDVFRDVQHGDTSAIEGLVEAFADKVYHAISNTPEMPEITHDAAKSHITLSVVNTTMNEELLQTVPHYSICDGELSAIPRWEISEEASFVVTNDLASQLGYTPSEILQIGQAAVDSQTFVTRPMQDVLAELIGCDPEDMFPINDGPTMLVVTSETGVRGSSVLLSENGLKEAYERIGGPIIALPSSVHEVICVDADVMSPSDLRNMVLSINCEQVAPDERLSDEIFTYDGRSLRLVVGDDISMSLAPDNMSISQDDAPSIRMAG